MMALPGGAGTDRLGATRYQYSATDDSSGVELVIDFDGLLQLERSGFRMDPCSAGHRNHLHQFGPRSPIGKTHDAAVGRAPVVEVMVPPIQANKGPNAVL